MTPAEVLAVLDVGIRGTELPPTLEAAHRQLRELARTLASIDHSTGLWVTRNEADALSALIDNEMADGSSKYGRTPDTMVDLGRLQDKLDGDT